MTTIGIASAIYDKCPPQIRRYWDRVAASATGMRLVHGALWSLVGAIVSRILGLASFVMVARVLGKAGYGQFGIVQSTVGMFGVFAGFGLGQTATKYVAELRNTDPERAGRIMGMAGIVASISGITMAGILFFFAPWLATNTLAAPELAPVLRIGSFILILEAMNGAQLGALTGFEAFKTTAKIHILVGITCFPMMAIGVYAGGLEGSVWALAANRALNWLLNHLALRKEALRSGIPFVLGGSKKELSVLWSFSIPAMLSGIMVTPTLWICNAMLVNQPNGYEQMGIFQAANSFRQILLFFGTTLGAPLLPMLANLLGSGRKNERLERINILSSWFLGTIPAIFLFGLPEIAQAVYGNEFAGREFINTFLLTVFATSILIYKQGLARILSVHGLMWWGMLSNLIWAVIMIVCTRLLISYGAFGYSIAWAIAYSVNVIIFIPLYMYKNLTPKGTIISARAGMIWLILLICMALTLFQATLFWRVISIPLSLSVIAVLFRHLLKPQRTLAAT